ncbi:Dna2/Cas4 domain-containing protein [Candidatus Woesearchaeota archaeon]|nr:Dna2/Cas4 domain-containing protein [Candidatus Woesearchaeota archaeon]
MPATIPVHYLTTYLFCQRKLFLEEVLDMRPPRTKTDRKRAILHEALRYSNRAEPGVVKAVKGPVPHAKVADLYYNSNRRSLQEAIINNKEKLASEGLSIIDTHKQLWQDLKQPTKARIQNTYDFMTKNRLYGNDLWWHLIPKITFNLNLSSDKLGIQMNLYRVDNYPQSAVPYLITRQDPPDKGVWHTHKHELILAMMLLAEQGLIVQEGVVGYREGQTERKIELTPDLREQAQERLDSLKRLLADHNLPEKVHNQKKCERCPHRERCYDDQFMAAKLQEKGF